MNDNQKKCYDLVRDSIHDEQHDCTNLGMLIAASFPEGCKKSTLVEAMQKVVKPYFDVRAELGGNVMQIFHELEKEDKL